MTTREKMAKAMFDRHNWFLQPGFQGTWSKFGREKWLAVVDAGLLVLLEPTQEMLGAIDKVRIEELLKGPPDTVLSYAMFRAGVHAVKEGK